MLNGLHCTLKFCARNGIFAHHPRIVATRRGLHSIPEPCMLCDLLMYYMVGNELQANFVDGSSVLIKDANKRGSQHWCYWYRFHSDCICDGWHR